MSLYDVKCLLEDSIEFVKEDKVTTIINTETGEVLTEKEFKKLVESLGEGIENLCLWIKNLRAEAEMIKAEKLKLAKRQTTAENKADRLAAYVQSLLGGEKFKTAKVVVSYTTSHPLDVDEDAEIPAEYWKQAEPTLDKEGLKKAIKGGLVVKGCRILDKKNMVIK